MGGDIEDLLSGPHSPPQGLVILNITIPIPGHDAAIENARYSPLQNVVKTEGRRCALLSHCRKYKGCWAFLVMELVLRVHDVNNKVLMHWTISTEEPLMFSGAWSCHAFLNPSLLFYLHLGTLMLALLLFVSHHTSSFLLMKSHHTWVISKLDYVVWAVHCDAVVGQQHKMQRAQHMLCSAWCCWKWCFLSWLTGVSQSGSLGLQRVSLCLSYVRKACTCRSGWLVYTSGTNSPYSTQCVLSQCYKPHEAMTEYAVEGTLRVAFSSQHSY